MSRHAIDSCILVALRSTCKTSLHVKAKVSYRKFESSTYCKFVLFTIERVEVFLISISYYALLRLLSFMFDQDRYICLKSSR